MTTTSAVADTPSSQIPIQTLTATETPTIPTWLAPANDAAGIVTALAAVIALAYAMKQAGSAMAQSKASATANAQSAKTARAIFLFELDKRWEGQDMADSRIEFSTLYETLHADASQSNPAAGNKKHRETLQNEFARELSSLRKEDIQKYHKIMQIMGFFETAGMLVRQGYIPEIDILELYAGSIVRSRIAFSKHIADLADEKDALTGMYEHSLWLFQKAQAYVDNKSEPKNH